MGRRRRVVDRRTAEGASWVEKKAVATAPRDRKTAEDRITEDKKRR